MADNQNGFSMLELIMTIVIFSIGVVSVLPLIMQITVHSVGPIQLQQANAIAQAHLEEILSQPYSDPDQTELELGSTEPGETNRASFDDVQDYSVLPEDIVRDYNNAAISALRHYTVTVNITPASLGPNKANSLRVDVRVTHSDHSDITTLLSGYRSKD